MEQRRRKVTSGEAAAAAADIVPDPLAPAGAPPHEQPSTRVDATPASSSTPGAGAADPTRGPWGTIIDTVLSLDPESTFGRLRSGLTLGSDHTSYAHVAAALDVADSRYFEASQLVRAAKLEELRVDREIEERREILRTTARKELEAEKRKQAEAAGSKAMGKASAEEVADRCRASWPDEWARLARRSDEYHAARAVTEELATAWRSRASSLRELIAGLRSGR